jgi:two-component system, NtrC family, response regulator AtoC
MAMKSQQEFKVFIVEDDAWYSSMLEYYLSLNPDYSIKKFEDAKSVLKELHEKPQVVTLDYSLPDTTGGELLKQIKELSPETQVVIISAQEDVKVALELLRMGAYDYIVKDEDAKDKLWNTISKIRENADLKSELEVLKKEVKRKYDFSNVLVGKSDMMAQVYALMEKATKTNITVSIYGETGTGKELVAKCIHYNSLREGKPFVAVNVAAIPKDLLESELFGHEKGAFTGAISRRIGKFEEAAKGTLFLDEIGEMDLSMQAKLLRVLQEKEITRVGSNDVVPIEARIIVATHKNLAQEVKNGRFREDLYYRLLGLPIELPPLRERDNDALIIAKHFIDHFCAENKMKKKMLSADAKQKISRHPWPGNIRELKSVIELACVMCEGEEIEGLNLNINNVNGLSDFLMHEATLKEYTQRLIQHYLDKYNYDVLRVAKKLDIGKSTIYRMIQNKELNQTRQYYPLAS